MNSDDDRRLFTGNTTYTLYVLADLVADERIVELGVAA